MIIGLVATGAAFLFFRFQPITIPLFESYPKGTMQALDRGVYDALLALRVPAENVEFRKVENKWSGQDEWTYSDLVVQLSRQESPEKIKGVFQKTLAAVEPAPRVRYSEGPRKETVIQIAVNRHQTHQITLVPHVLRRAVPEPEQKTEKKALVAIIIDDIGYDDRVARQLLALEAPLCFSILPHSTFQKKVAQWARDRGRDVLLHLPMEPVEFPEVDPGKGALLTAMTPDEMLDQLKANLEAVPFIVGVNNHMGSRLTQDSAKMRQIFTVLKRRNLFFVDSVTTSNSHCLQAAKLLQLPFAQRQVFLDHVQENDAIRFQIRRLISIAKSRGKAIGIGHPYPATLEVLKKELPGIQREVRLVPVSSLVG